MRQRTGWVLVLAALLMGPTWPEDDKGRPAGQCSFISSSGVPTLCSATDPLPTSAAATTTSSTDPSSFGKRWIEGTTFARFAAATFTGDLTAVAVKVNAGGTALELFNSSDGGRTFTLVYTTSGPDTPFANPNNVRVLRRSTTSAFLLGLSHAGGNTAIWRAGGSLTKWLESSATGLPAGFREVFAIEQQGSTFLLANSSATDSRTCRSTDDGVTWTCTDPAGVTRLLHQSIATPALNTWLLIDNTVTNRNVARSTDDGATFTALTTLPDGGQGGQAIVCISGTVCLASAGSKIYRSTDAGLSFTEVFTVGATPVKVKGFVNFGAGVVVAFADSDVTTMQPYLSVTSGQTWTPLPLVTRTTSVSPEGYQTETRGGRAILTYHAVTGGNSVIVSTQALGPIISSIDGNNWEINAAGEGGVFQGTAGADPWPTAGPVQRGTIQNSRLVSAANAAVSYTLAAAAAQSGHVYRIEARCSAGTSNLLLSIAAVTVWDTGATEVGVTNFVRDFPTAITGGANQAVVVTLATCGVGNTGTLMVQGDRY